MCCDKKIQIKPIVINSADRTAGTSSNFTCSIQDALEGVINVRLLNAQIPNTIFNITSSNNVLVFTETTNTYTITLTPGAYTTATLSVALAAALNAVYANTFVVSFNTTTLKTTISGTNVFVLNLSQSTMNSVLGFGTTDTASATSHTGSNVYNLGIPTPIYVVIKEIGAPLSTTDGCSYTFNIPMDQNSINFVNFNINTQFQQLQMANRVYLKSFTVMLKSRGYADVDLNGANWSFTLEITQERPN